MSTLGGRHTTLSASATQVIRSRGRPAKRISGRALGRAAAERVVHYHGFMHVIQFLQKLSNPMRNLARNFQSNSPPVLVAL